MNGLFFSAWDFSPMQKHFLSAVLISLPPYQNVKRQQAAGELADVSPHACVPVPAAWWSAASALEVGPSGTRAAWLGTTLRNNSHGWLLVIILYDTAYVAFISENLENRKTAFPLLSSSRAVI